MLLTLFYITIIFYGIAFAQRVLGSRKIETTTAFAGLLCNGAALILISLQSDHLPFFNIFESFLFVTFVLGAIGLFAIKWDFYDVRLWIWFEILILLVITLIFPKQPSPPLYDHNYIYIFLFFGFRCITLALMMCASAHFIQFIIKRDMEDRIGELLHEGRNFLILSSVTFLIAEYVGILWVQKGWGDFWMWSSGFFSSTLIVLYLMLAFHIPGKGKRSEGVRSVIGGLSALIMLTVVILRSLG